MSQDHLEKIAYKLALRAVAANRGNNVEKRADDAAPGFSLADLYTKAQPYLSDPRVVGGLAGLGAGGLIGLTQPRRKLRNALTYGLVGGLGGAGLGHAWSNLAKPPAPEQNTPPPQSRNGWTPHPDYVAVQENPNATYGEKVRNRLAHPYSAANDLFDGVGELYGYGTKWLGQQGRYLDKQLLRAGDAAGAAFENARGSQFARDVLQDHTQRMQRYGDAAGGAFDSARRNVNDAARFARDVLQDHTQRMQRYGDAAGGALYDAGAGVYDASKGVYNWFNGRR